MSDTPEKTTAAEKTDSSKGRSTDHKGSDWAFDDETAKGSSATGSDWQSPKDDAKKGK